MTYIEEDDITLCAHKNPSNDCLECEINVLRTRISDLTTRLESAEREAKVYREAIEWLEYETLDLRCLSVPTGGDDYDVVWVVIQHYMDEPQEREIARSDTILSVIGLAKAAIAAGGE